MEDLRRIEFQRIHRISKKSSRYTRPVIARFLRFQDRELVFNAAREMRDSLEVKVFADLRKEGNKGRISGLSFDKPERKGNEHSSAGKNRTSSTLMEFWCPNKIG